MKINKIETQCCVGCGVEFVVISFDDKNPAIYCNPDCEENHSIFK